MTTAVYAGTFDPVHVLNSDESCWMAAVDFVSRASEYLSTTRVRVDMNELKEAEKVLQHIRETRMYRGDLPMEDTISYLQVIRELLDEDIAFLREEAKSK